MTYTIFSFIWFFVSACIQFGISIYVIIMICKLHKLRRLRKEIQNLKERRRFK